MSRFHRNTLALGFAVLLALPFVAPAPVTAGTERYITISSLPYTISTPGGYQLTANIVTPMQVGEAITIACDNVTLDLNGFTISSTTNVGPVYGIYSSGFNNITIRNGKLRRFATAVSVMNSRSLVVEDVTCIDTIGVAIRITDSYGALVRRCSVTQMANTSSYAGIRMSGHNAFVQDCILTKSGGIDMSGCVHAVVERNNVANDNPGYYYGWTAIKFDSHNCIAVGNRITQFGTGISFGPSGYYRDNFTDSVVVKYVGGTDAGNNF